MYTATIESIQQKVQKKITEKRFLHSIGVQYTATMLAMRYETDLTQAALAGILHDCAKCMTDEKMLYKCKKHNIAVTETEQRLPYLLHAKLGAYYAKHKYGISDADILSAITWHTTGKPDMTVLEQILFIADYIEPHRKMLSILPQIRKMAFINLDETCYLILKATIDYLNTLGDHTSRGEIEEHTLQAYQYYEKLHQQNLKKGDK